MIRFGLCCQFSDEPIKFRTTTAKFLQRLSKQDGLKKLSTINLHNAATLMQALQYCHKNGIRSFRVGSTILPLRTHPEVGYQVERLPAGKEIIRVFKECGKYAAEKNIRLSFHPDQFVVLNSPNPQIVQRSISDLQYHAEVSQWIGADVINIHGGGAYNDKYSALKRLQETIHDLDQPVRSRLTLENDDRVFTPSDLLPVCRELGVPLVYDIHHHRCLPDNLSLQNAAEYALRTWNREPLFHISSPLEGWKGPKPQRHHDYINIQDFPFEWLDWNLTVDIEAKAKELAVNKIRNELNQFIERRKPCQLQSSLPLAG